MQLRSSIKDKQMSKFVVAPTRAAARPRAATTYAQQRRNTLVGPRMTVSKFDPNESMQFPKAKAKEISIPTD